MCPGAPLTYFNDGGIRVIFLGLKFWPKVIFGVCERHQDFFRSRKITEGFFWVVKKRLKDFLGYVKKHSNFFGWTNFEVVIFLGIKYEPLSDLPPPSPVINICEWGPWGCVCRVR